MDALAVVLLLLFVAATCLTNMAVKPAWLGLLIGVLAGTLFAIGSIYLLYVLDGRREKFIGIALLFGGFYANVASAILSSLTYVVRLFLARTPRRQSGYCNTCGYCLYGNQSGICPECGGVISSQQMIVLETEPRTEVRGRPHA